MSENSFFKPTQLYKEFMILDLIAKNSQITQREMANSLDIAVSMVNNHLDDYEKKGLIKRKKISTKNVSYFITKKGIERKKVLNISYLNSSLVIYKSAKENISDFLNQIIEKGFKNILLYGAGEVAEILLQTVLIDSRIPIRVLAVIDDNVSKQGKRLVNSIIIDLNNIDEFDFDAILISSYTNQKKIFDKLILMNYKQDKILRFFD